MSSGVNIKTMSQAQQGSSMVSGIPLPRGMTPHSKLDPKHQGGISHQNRSAQFQSVRTRLPLTSYSSSSSPYFSNEMLRGVASKSLLLQHRGSISSPNPLPRGSRAPERGAGSRSAYSSPQVSKRQAPAPRSKDTLYLCNNSSISHKSLRELNGNRNRASGGVHHHVDDNGDAQDALCVVSSDNVHSGQIRGRMLCSKAGNGNTLLPSTQTRQQRREPRNLSSIGRGWSERDKHSSKPRTSHLGCGGGGASQTVSVPHQESEPSRVNMATVAPFR